MSRVLPRRRPRGRDPRAGESRPAHRPAFVESDDVVPRTSGATTSSATSATSASAGGVRRTPAPAEAPGRVADATPARTRTGTTSSSLAHEAPDPDLPALSAATELSLQMQQRPRGFVERHRNLFTLACIAAVLGGVTLLVLALLETGPAYFDDLGAVVVLGGYTWALAARTGGRPAVFGLAAVAAAVGVLASEQPYLRTGAAVMMCCISATLAVVATVPATGFAKVVRECVLAVVIASVGALATLGFAPTISLVRFEYATLALSLLAAFGVVYRLGAGLHGLGRRGVAVVLFGAGVLLVTLLYAETLRRYGPPDLVLQLLDVARWSREHLGAFPRPVEAVLGIPALAWGVSMRARRRQGWWVCAFGAAGTATVANSLLNPAITFRECGLSVVYGLVIGLVIGYVVIRVDLALAGTGAGGRRSEEHAAARPEPTRTASLL